MNKLAFACAVPALLWAVQASGAESDDLAVPTAALPDLEPEPPPQTDVAPALQSEAERVPMPHTAPAPPPGAVTEFRAPPPPPPGQRRSRFATPAHAPMPVGIDSGGERTEPQGKWYGWQTLLLDMGSFAAIVAGAEGDSGALTALGVAGYLAGGPVVHAFHDDGGKAWGSFGLRLGAPLGGALAGALVGSLASSRDCSGSYCELNAPVVGAFIGFAAGLVTAITVDTAYLAHDDSGADRRDAQPARKQAQELTLAPTVAVTPKGAVTGLAGTF